MKPKLLCACLILVCIQAFSQSSDHFLVSTSLSNPESALILNGDSLSEDTVQRLAMFVIDINPPSGVDSVAFTLTDSQQQLVYSGSLSMADLQSQPCFSTTGHIFCYTVGPYSHLRRYTVTALIRGTNGQFAPLRSFTKN